MAIEIQGPVGRSPAEIGDNSTATRKSEERHHSSVGATLTGSQDRFSLTDQAAQIQALENQVSGLPVVDAKRVTEVQQATATGELRINPKSVADKLLKFEVGMSSKA